VRPDPQPPSGHRAETSLVGGFLWQPIQARRKAQSLARPSKVEAVAPASSARRPSPSLARRADLQGRACAGTDAPEGPPGDRPGFPAPLRLRGGAPDPSVQVPALPKHRVGASNDDNKDFKTRVGPCPFVLLEGALLNLPLVALALTAALAGPVVAGVVAPSLLTGIASQGLAVHHRHFDVQQHIAVAHDDESYDVFLYNADIYEMPLTLQVVLRGAVVPPPSDALVDEAIHRILARYDLPVLSYDIHRDGADVSVEATLPAGVLANLSPVYRERLAAWESHA